MPKVKFQSIASIIISGLLVSLILLAYIVLIDKKADPQNKIIFDSKACAGLYRAQSCFPLEIANTDQARVNGLSKRESLPANSGMLFVFEDTAEQCIWMKDMRFALDIIWTNEAKRIIKIEQNVSPGTYPKNFCSDETKYVLEFSSGFAGQYGLKPGDELKFKHESR